MTRSADGEHLVARLVDVWRSSAESGKALPSEPRLAEATGSSRNSVREALIRMEERGYVHRSQGSRTVINRRLAAVGTRLDQQRDHSASIAAAGYEPALTVITSEFVRLSSARPRFDDLAEGELVLRTVKKWTADGHPFVLAEDLIPLGAGVEACDIDSRRPVFDLAEQLNGIDVAWETVWFASALLSADEAEALETELPAAALELVYVGIGAGDEAAYWCREIQTSPPARLRNALVRRVDRS